jgi:hypothetical protein
LHGAFERGGVVKGQEGREGEPGGDAVREVSERERGAARGLSGLGERDGKAVGSRDDEDAGACERGEKGSARAGEVPVRGGLG